MFFRQQHLHSEISCLLHNVIFYIVELNFNTRCTPRDLSENCFSSQVMKKFKEAWLRQNGGSKYYTIFGRIATFVSNLVILLSWSQIATMTTTLGFIFKLGFRSNRASRFELLGSKIQLPPSHTGPYLPKG